MHDLNRTSLNEASAAAPTATPKAASAIVAAPTTPAKGPEILFGLVGALGTDMERVVSRLGMALGAVRYSLQEIELQDLLYGFPGATKSGGSPQAAKNSDRNSDRNSSKEGKNGTAARENPSAGGRERRFREVFQDKGALAYLAMDEVHHLRIAQPAKRRAYVIHSLTTPEEVKALREVYGKSFIAISVYASRESRLKCLQARATAGGLGGRDAEDLLAEVKHEAELPYGHDLEAAFPLSDFFLEADAPKGEMAAALLRIVELLFGNLFHAPTRDEFAMFHAVSAGVRSSSLARQVGAAISTPEGEIIALGCNDVPKAGGGLYWEGDEGDARDHLHGYDFNDQMKTLFVRDLLGRLQEQGWLDGQFEGLDGQALFEQAMAPGSSLRSAEIMKVIEYGRTVHAEMAVLMDAAKRGISVEGCTLYTTTFPCHSCAKHIIAAGVKRVVYVEPYPKSFTRKLYSDSVWVSGEGPMPDRTMVRFEPFVGISYRQYFSLFSMGGHERKLNGTPTPWVAETALPRYYDHASACLAREAEGLSKFEETLARLSLERVFPPYMPNGAVETGEANAAAATPSAPLKKV